MKIEINNELCTGCMLCVKDCISGVWQISGSRPYAGYPENCTLCSHCLAVCPSGAVRHSSLDPAGAVRIDRGRVCPEVIETVVKGRRSIRQFRQEKVPDQLIHRLISLASHSPTASNSQNVGYTVITAAEILSDISETIFGFAVGVYQVTRKFPGNLIYRLIRLFPGSESISRYLDAMPHYMEETGRGKDFILHRAPALILVHGPEGRLFSCENCNIAAANIMNHAYAIGLGTCYIGFLTLYLKYGRKLGRRIRIPKKRRVYAALAIGFPSYRHSFSASRKHPEAIWLE